MSDELPILEMATPRRWEAWLAKNHASSPGVWLKIAKVLPARGGPRDKSAAIATVTYAEALDGALCYGWIDGQKGALDDAFWLQRFTPRRPKSKWSKINCGKVEALIAAGRMKAAGLREVEVAKADGRWEAAYDSHRTATVPDDLKRALDASPEAAAFFATLSAANRYAILYRVQDAKKPETRAKRIETFVRMLVERKTLH
jgi:uncharacterized protein YdeI (YjbR/CyaY-like superfamily)